MEVWKRGVVQSVDERFGCDVWMRGVDERCG